MENSQVTKGSSFLDGLRSLEIVDVKLLRLDWPQMWPIKVPVWEHEILLTASNGSIAKGRGSDASYQTSVLKALSESIERRQMQRSINVSSSNGWAAHTDIEAAVLQAKWEVMERDLYLCHVLTGTPFQEISLDHGDIPEWVRELVCYLHSKYGIEIVVGIMGEHSTISAISVAVFGGSHFGTITSQAVSDSFAKSVQKALVHCLRNVSYELSGSTNPEPMSLKAFRSLNRVNPRHHYLLGLHPDSAPFIRRLYSKKKSDVRLEYAD